MFGLKKRRQKKAEKKKEFDQAIRKGLLFWLPGGASRLDVYVDYCIIHSLGKTKMEEKSRIIPFNDITKVVYTPASMNRMATLQLFTRDMPDVQRRFWYPYENNMVVVNQTNEDMARKVAAYIADPYGSNVVPPDYLNELRRERKRELREEKAAREAEAKETNQAEEEETAQAEVEETARAEETAEGAETGEEEA